jgi:lysophospholipase L1-like esterase
MKSSDPTREHCRLPSGIDAGFPGMPSPVRVPYQQAFDAALRRAPAAHRIWDGIHPTDAGHPVMAEAWVPAVRSVLPESRR